MKSGMFSALALLLGAGLAVADTPPEGMPPPPIGSTAPPGVGGSRLTPVSNIEYNGPAFVPNGPVVHNGQPVLPGSALTGQLGGGPICYASSDALLWWIRKGTIPQTSLTVPVGVVAVTFRQTFTGTATPPFPDPSNPNNLNQSTFIGVTPAAVVNTGTLGEERFTNPGSHGGFRTELGFWIDQDQSFGFCGSFFALETTTDPFNISAAANGSQFILNSGFSNQTILVTGVGVGVPPQLTVVATDQLFVVRQTQATYVGSSSTNLWGAELNTRGTGLRIGCVDFGGLIGVRYLNFEDRLIVASQLRLTRPAGIPDGPDIPGEDAISFSNDLTYSTFDRTLLRNKFLGAQVGFDMDAKFAAIFLNARVKMAVGNMRQEAALFGLTNIVNNNIGTSPANTQSPGGLLVSPLDVGKRRRDTFSFVPELNLKLGLQVFSWLRVYGGYDGLYMTNTARAGASVVYNTLTDNIRVGNTNQAVPVVQPSFRFRETDTWVQGLNFGCEIQY